MWKKRRELVRPERLELPTLCSEGRCSIRLSYGRGPECILRQIPNETERCFLGRGVETRKGPLP